MKTLALAIAATAIITLAPEAAANTHRGAWVHRGPVYYGHAYYPRYYIPFSFYVAPYAVAPYYAYAGPRYAPPPLVVERRYVERVPLEPATPQYREGERSHAQIVPEPQRAESRAAVVPPKLERITLSAKSLFAFDKAELIMPQPRLDEIAEALRSTPSIEHVRITGYTDRLGTDAYNMKLSQRRADLVKNYLIEKGVAGKRLEAIGKGESDPVVECTDKKMADLIKCLEPNRRVEVESITIEVRR
jgi:outer membrane protein OmpA-like peptidoglycan-associated protein